MHFFKSQPEIQKEKKFVCPQIFGGKESWDWTVRDWASKELSSTNKGIRAQISVKTNRQK